MTVAEYVVHRLEELNIKHVFMLPGGGAMHLNDALGRSDKIEYVGCLHEQACAIAAEAYARVNNRIGVCMVTTGPGGTNALTGVAGAYLESTPVMVISGQVKRADMINGQHIRQQGMQEFDIVSVVKPMTKYAAVIDDPLLVRYHYEKALYEAIHGRKGPVWLDIPLDVQATQVDEDALVPYIPFETSKTLSERTVLEIITKINNAKRPVLLIGNGIRMAGAEKELTELVRVLNIPVLTTWNGIDLITEDDPLYFGRPGGLGHRYANFIQQNSDLLICIGARMNLLQTGYNFDGFAREAYKVMIDIDPNELHKTNVRPDMPVCCDAKVFIQAMLRNKEKIVVADRPSWFEYCRSVKEAYPLVTDKEREPDAQINTYFLVEEISKAMKPDDVYVSGSSGSCIDISMQTIRVKQGQRVFCTKGLASMGYGFPSAIGACLASGGRMTVGLNGDGGFMMNVQELATLKRLGLPVKMFVLCNNGYGAIQATQTNIFHKNFVDCNPQSGLEIPDIARISEAFGLKTLKIRTNKEAASVIKDAFEYDGPVIITVYTPIELTARPKQVSYKRSDGQMESLPLEYMNPPIPDEELKERMLVPLYERK